MLVHECVVISSPCYSCVSIKVMYNYVSVSELPLLVVTAWTCGADKRGMFSAATIGFVGLSTTIVRAEAIETGMLWH